ncbi:MAG: beta-lactamase family protein [Acidimicrobiales bacterium]|nr:beta-lactamase family protein [Acidimicrobiales bacterium]
MFARPPVFARRIPWRQVRDWKEVLMGGSRRAGFAAFVVAMLATVACSGYSNTTAADPVQPAPSGTANAALPGGPSDADGAKLAERVFPDPDWQVADPLSLGFDPAVLESVRQKAEDAGSNCLLVTRNGRIAAEWYWNGTDEHSAQEVFSATKSFTSSLVGIAQAEGKLDIDDPATKYIPEWIGTPSEAVTVKNLISNNSGRHWDFETDYVKMAVGAQDKTRFAIELGQDAPPGEVWAYNNAAIQTLDRVIARATGMPTHQYAEEKLLGPIGMRDSVMRTDPVGNTLTFMGLQSTCRDMARFGYLFLNKGNWNGNQVIPEAWVEEATRPSQDLNVGYGYLWWLNRRGRLANPVQPVSAIEGGSTPDGQMAPGMPEDLYWALGLGNQIIAVSPSTGVVTVRLGTVNHPRGSTFGNVDAARPAVEGLRSP